tara:strand:- start:284 stop:550 length:267 start_codon:yes stop_codon:yes gene_type:complete
MKKNQIELIGLTETDKVFTKGIYVLNRNGKESLVQADDASGNYFTAKNRHGITAERSEIFRITGDRKAVGQACKEFFITVKKNMVKKS